MLFVSRETLLIYRLPIKPLLMLVILCFVATGCTTRQLTDNLQGSTAQRLVTYSLENFLEELVQQPQLALKNSKVNLNINFVEEHPLTRYANQLLVAKLESTHGIRVSGNGEPADYQIEVFFNSLGTDQDSFGLSLPTLGLAGVSDSRIDILALDRFHGVTEGYALVRSSKDGTRSNTRRLLSRVRADSVTTPILTFPLNQLD